MSTPNPYATSSAEHQSHDSRGPTGTFVRQVRIVAILMIIQGILELLFSIYFLVMGFVLPQILAQQPNQMPVAQQEMMTTFFFGYFVLGGATALLVGLLRIPAGIMGLMFRGRVFGIVSLLAGILVFVTVYCMPTSIAVCVYGCIVYFNRDVANAFRMKKQGRTTEDILTYYRN